MVPKQSQKQNKPVLMSGRRVSICPETFHIFLGMNTRQLSLKAEDSFSCALTLRSLSKDPEAMQKSIVFAEEWALSSFQQTFCPPMIICIYCLSLNAHFIQEEKQRKFYWYWNIGLDLGTEANAFLTPQFQTAGAGEKCQKGWSYSQCQWSKAWVGVVSQQLWQPSDSQRHGHQQDVQQTASNHLVLWIKIVLLAVDYDSCGTAILFGPQRSGGIKP